MSAPIPFALRHPQPPPWQMADLEGADRSFAFTSGMLALTVAMSLVPHGGHIVTGTDIYGGTSRLLSRIAPQQDSLHCPLAPASDRLASSK